MQKNKHLQIALAILICASMVIFGRYYLVYGTTIGTNISTAAFTGVGNASTTGTFTVVGTTTLGTNFYVDAVGNASTSGTYIVTGSTTLTTLTVTNEVVTNSTIGGGTAITKLMHGTVALNPPSIAAITTGIATNTLSGATADMKCFVQAPTALNDELIQKGCTTTADVIGVYIYNAASSTAVDDGSLNWGYFLIK